MEPAVLLKHVAVWWQVCLPAMKCPIATQSKRQKTLTVSVWKMNNLSASATLITESIAYAVVRILCNANCTELWQQTDTI